MKTIKIIINKEKIENTIGCTFFTIWDIKKDKLIRQDKGNYNLGVFNQADIKEILSESQLKEFELGANTFEVNTEVLAKLNPEYAAPEEKPTWAGIHWFTRWLLYTGFFIMLIVFGLGTAGGSTTPSNKRYRKVIKHGFWGKTTYYIER